MEMFVRVGALTMGKLAWAGYGDGSAFGADSRERPSTEFLVSSIPLSKLAPYTPGSSLLRLKGTERSLANTG